MPKGKLCPLASVVTGPLSSGILLIAPSSLKAPVDLGVNLGAIVTQGMFYKGKQLDELDVQAILLLQPQTVIVDELAHTNIPGSKNEKRWQDVLDIMEAGINVISAINIQHIESINEDVKSITGIEVKERVPDKLLQLADEVVNIDLTADELITRLKEGKIYDSSKVQQALQNFFKPEKILQLRELALKEVAGHQEDHNVAFPLDRLNELARDGVIGSVAGYHYSFMGAAPIRKIEPKARELAGLLKKDRVDAVLLSPV